MDLKGKIAFVTGGGSGIGAAISKQLDQAGASVVVFDLNEEAKEITRSFENESLFTKGNVAKSEDVNRASKRQ